MPNDPKPKRRMSVADYVARCAWPMTRHEPDLDPRPMQLPPLDVAAMRSLAAADTTRERKQLAETLTKQGVQLEKKTVEGIVKRLKRSGHVEEPQRGALRLTVLGRNYVAAWPDSQT